MKTRLYKLLLKHFSGPFVVTFFLAMFVLMMQFLWKYIADLAGKGLEASVVAELLFYATAHLVPMALPLAVLLSSIMAFGGLAENNELIAFKTAGFSLLRLLLPLSVLVLIFSFGSFYFMNKILPQANLKFGALFWDIKTKKPVFEISENVFYNGIEGYSIRVAKKDNNSSNLYDILIYDHTEMSENLIVMRAERGFIQMNEGSNIMTFTLFNGYRYEEMRNTRTAHMTNPHSRLKFSKYMMEFDMSSFNLDRSDIQLFRGNYKMMNMKELTQSIDSVLKEYDKLPDMTRQSTYPYMYILRDSSLTKYKPRPIKLKNDNMILNFDASQRTAIMARATSSARTVYHIVLGPSNLEQMYLGSKIGYEVEYHRKIVISFVILLLFMIGAPMGAIIRKGGLGMPTVVSIILFISFYIISIIGEKLAKETIVAPAFGMWLPVMILLPCAIFLVHKANTDSRLFKVENLRIRFLEKFFSSREINE